MSRIMHSTRSVAAATVTKAPGKGNRSVKAATRPGRGEAVDHAYRTLRDQIISLGVLPGEHINDEVLRRLGLSRTPAREAMARLAGEGLVELMPNRGACVALLRWADIREHLEALDVMQRLTTRLAAIRRRPRDLERIRAEQAAFERAAEQHTGVELTEANLRFHEAVGAACGNSIFANTYLRVLTKGLRMDRHAMFEDSFTSADRYQGHLDRIISDHREMVSAIEAADPDRAEAVARSHAELARCRITEAVTGGEGPQFDLSIDQAIDPTKGGPNV